MLDRTARRILGVLVEKELSVPDSYPLTANSLLSGCNQKSNREPEMSLETFELDGALMAMQLDGWVVKIEGGRSPKYRHKIEDKLGVRHHEKAVLAELLLRGPQAPGALKARVARMGFDAESPDEVATILTGLRDRDPSLVRQLPRAPRERDQRWAHTLGDDGDAFVESESTSGDLADDPSPAPATPTPATPTAAATPATNLAARVEELEREGAELRREVAELRALLS